METAHFEPSDNAPVNAQAEDELLHPVAAALLGGYFLVLVVGLGGLMLWLWPASPTSSTANLDEEVRLMLLVLVAGAFGSFLHASTSFADYVGNRRLRISWVWWYIMRPFIGAVLALVFYFAVRGGLLSAAADTGNISQFGIMALAGLVGMFSKQATDKLREVFDTLFKTADQRKDKLTNPVPIISAVEPVTFECGGRVLDITVSGEGFVPAATVRVNGADRLTDFVNTTRLRSALLATDLDQPGSLRLTVFNPGPGGGTSEPVLLQVVTPEEIPTDAALDGALSPPSS